MIDKLLIDKLLIDKLLIDNDMRPATGRRGQMRFALAGSVAAALSLAAAAPGLGQGSGQGAERANAAARQKAERSDKQSKAKTHKLAIQVNDDKPETMNLALNNAKNVVDYYKTKGEAVAVEIVTFGPGLHMLRDDTSPVKARIAALSLEEPAITFAACANTQGNMSKREEKPITLLPEARVVPSGVVRLMELQRQGYAYIRP